MSETTPTPWATNGKRVESRDEHGIVNDGWIICDCDGPDAEANASFIIQAVNAHEAMKEALKRARHELQWAYDCMDVPPADGILEGLQKAIDLAEGKSDT